jgi:WD40 repeat protein
VTAAVIQRSQGDVDQAHRADSDKARKTKVFVSYSRADGAFADSIAEILQLHGFEILIDRSDIHAFEEWWKRIETLIAQADAVIFLISPDAVASKVCNQEVEYAASLNKRFAPVVYRHVDTKEMPQALAQLNFIFFEDELQFDQGMDRLVEALNTDIEWVRKHTEFGEQARRWAAEGRPDGLLLRSPTLEQAEHWSASRPQNAPLPTKETQGFIERSRRAATTRRNVLTGSLAVGLLGMSGLAGAAFWQREIAERNEEQAKLERDRALRTQSLFLAYASRQQFNTGDAGTGLLLAVEALPHAVAGIERPYVPEAGRALKDALSKLDERIVLKGHENSVSSAAFSPDGKRIVTASEDATARLWNAETGQLIGEPLRHEKSVWSAAFSPDGRRIVTASQDATARLWDAATGQPIGQPLRHEGILGSAAFSPDGKRIVTASGDTWHGILRLWNAATGQPIGQPLEQLIGPAGGLPDRIWSVAFSPDGRRIVAAFGESALLWNAETRQLIGQPLRHEASVSSAAFSPDGKRIVTASQNAAWLWNAETGQLIGEPLRHQSARFAADWVKSAAFRPDGKRILTASQDAAWLWYDESGTWRISATRLGGHAGPVRSAAFSPDGERVVTSSGDRTARLWDTSGLTWQMLMSAISISFSKNDEIVTKAKTEVPRGLTASQRKSFFLDPEPPAWYIEMDKWPYHTPAWKRWLADKKLGKQVPIPG